jgi:hypothetical protein
MTMTRKEKRKRRKKQRVNRNKRGKETKTRQGKPTEPGFLLFYSIIAGWLLIQM